MGLSRGSRGSLPRHLIDIFSVIAKERSDCGDPFFQWRGSLLAFGPRDDMVKGGLLHPFGVRNDKSTWKIYERKVI